MSSSPPPAEAELVSRLPLFSEMKRRRLVEALEAPTPVTIATLVTIVAVYLLSLLLVREHTGELRLEPGHISLLGANMRLLVLDGQPWRLITAMFLHANLVHLLMNGWALWVLGRPVEKLLGSARLCTLIVLSGLAGSAASLLSSGSPSVGISGAVFGLLGALYVIGKRFRDWMPAQMATSLWKSVLPLLAINLVLGFVIPNIDMAAHVGGLIGGGLVTSLMASRMSETKQERLRSQGIAGLCALLAALACAVGTLHVLECGLSVDAMDACYARYTEELLRVFGVKP